MGDLANAGAFVEPTEITVQGFLSFEAVQHADGSIQFVGRTRVHGQTYFFNLKTTKGEDGQPRIRLGDARFETMTGKNVRGKANIELEELMDAAKDAALNWAREAIDLDVRNNLIERKRSREISPFSEESFAATDAIREATVRLIEQRLADGEPPVFGDSNMFMVIHPSAKSPGLIQVTRFNNRGIFGDSQYNDADSLIADNNLVNTKTLSRAEASKRLSEALGAEAEYQARRCHMRTSRLLLNDSVDLLEEYDTAPSPR